MGIDLRVDKTKTFIQKSFIHLLEVKHFEKITVKDICRSAKVGRSTFYTHYSDKFDLFEQIITSYTDLFDSLIQKRFSTTNLSVTLNSIFKELNVNKEELKVLFYSSFGEYALERNFLSILKKYISQYLGRISKYKRINLPFEFLVGLYSANAMVSIKYSLENELSEDISSFMENFFESAITKV